MHTTSGPLTHLAQRLARLGRPLLLLLALVLSVAIIGLAALVVEASGAVPPIAAAPFRW